MHVVLPSELAYRIVECALRLEQAEREKSDVRMAEALSALMEAARALRALEPQ